MTINVTPTPDVNITVISQQPLRVHVSGGGGPTINIIAPGNSPGTVNSVSNVGTGLGWSKGVSAGDLKIKSVLAGAGIEIINNGDDLTIKTVGGGTVYSGTSFPPSPNSGDIFYDENNNVLYSWSGTIWEAIVYSSQLSDPGGTLLVSGGSF